MTFPFHRMSLDPFSFLRNVSNNFFIKIKLVSRKYIASCCTEQNEGQICWCQSSALNYIVGDIYRHVVTDVSAANMMSSELNVAITYKFQFLAVIRSYYLKKDTLIKYP